MGTRLEHAEVMAVAELRPWKGGETLNDSVSSPFPQLHIVHYDSDSYGSLSEAAQRPQGLAVLGILIEVSGLQLLPVLSTSSASPRAIWLPASFPKQTATHPDHL